MTPPTALAVEHAVSPRLQAMREQVLHAPLEIGLARARAFTAVIRENPELPRSVQLAMGLRETFRGMPIAIADNERLVGRLTEKFKGAVVYPEIKSDFLIKELDNFSERDRMTFTLTDAERRELREEILPFWDGTSAFDEFWEKLSDETLANLEDLASVVQNDFSGASHLSHIDYDRVLTGGFEGIIARARDGRAALAEDDPDIGAKRAFYDAVIISAEAVIEFAARYAALARERVVREDDPERARELAAIADVMSRVPAKPARTFREALQATYLTYLAILQLDGGAEVPFGRFDQYLYPFYAQDLADGTCTRDEVWDLLCEFFLKIAQLTYIQEYAVTRVNDGNPMRPTLTIGGVDAAGRDATNELTFMTLDATDALRLMVPNIAVRLHPDAPDAFVTRLSEIMTNGSNALGVFNDDVEVAGFTRKGVPIEAAREYSLTGCVQAIAGDMYGPNCSSFLNGPKILEMTLNGGYSILSLLGSPEDMPTPEFETFEDLMAAFKAQLKEVALDAIGALDKVAETMDERLPNPILSALVGGTLEQGKDVKSGGAWYNETGIDLIGIGTLTDSLAAIRHVVYEEKTHTLDEVVEWMKADFDEYEVERQYMLNRAPKYGNGAPEVDRIAAEIVDFMDELLSAQPPTYRGGVYVLGLHTEAHHVYQGSMVAATADGRLGGMPLSVGCCPSGGADRNGPTATIESITAIDYSKVAGGASGNLRFTPSLFKTDAHVERFGDLLKTFFKLGGQHLHVNSVDTETLRDAQRFPEKYPDLMVRVAGYSARWSDLTLATQEEIIQRTEMQVC